MKQKIVFSAKYKRNYVAICALIFFFLIIICEIVLAFSIPAYIRKENVMAFEVRKLKLLENFDHARRVCTKLPERDENFIAEKKLVSEALDRLAIYFNREKDYLTPDDVDKLTVTVNQLHKIVLNLNSRRGKPFSNSAELNTAAWVDKTLANIEKKHKK